MPDCLATPLTGGCGCGAVRFELTAPPLAALYCHCTRCQRRTGTAAAVSARVDPDGFRIVRGAEVLGRWIPDGGLEKVFCACCGSALYAERPGTPRIVAVRMGAFDSDPGVRPSARQFVADSAVWEPIPDDGLPRYDGRMPPL